MASAPHSDSQPSYALGAPISLADLLALPPDGRRYARDENGMLILSPPDHADFHRTPLAILMQGMIRQLDDRSLVVAGGSVAFDPIYTLNGTVVPLSHHGLPCIEPDIICLRRPFRTIRASEKNKVYAPEDVMLVVELLSPSTWREDLGDGTGDKTDRWRTYLDGRVGEYWIVNAQETTCGIPARSVLALTFDPSLGTWSDVRVEAARHAPGDYRGRQALVGGRITSTAVPGLTLDIDHLWQSVG
ncbi:MAG: Uma2 family endonuclease [Labilithrix sp.]|nr:Uma2 family endonuclease [Labilithrix sp.]MCW5815258.1 Uma2 family endonuclease [Labilithrix sp.]